MPIQVPHPPHTGPYPQQPGPYPGNPYPGPAGPYTPPPPGTYAQQPGPYPAPPGQYPGGPYHAPAGPYTPPPPGAYPQQPGPYPAPPGQYPPGEYPQQPGPYQQPVPRRLPPPPPGGYPVPAAGQHPAALVPTQWHGPGTLAQPELGTPAAGAPPSGAPPSTPPPAEPKKKRPAPEKNRFARASLFLGLLSSVLGGTPLWPIFALGSVAAIVFGVVGLQQIRHTGGRQKGQGQAIVGTILGVVAIVVIAMVVLPSLRGSGSIVENGSFESSFGSSTKQSGSNLVLSIAGWKGTTLAPGADPKDATPNHCGFRVNNSQFTPGPAFAGHQWVELNANCVGDVVQTIRTSPRRTYDLYFAFGARPGTSPSQNQMQVLFDGAPVATVGPVAPSGSTINWSVYHYSVTAKGSQSTLTFRGTDPDAADTVGSELDNVVMVPQ